MQMRIFRALGFFLLVSTAHSQNLPAKSEAQNSVDRLNPDASVPPGQEQLLPGAPVSDVMILANSSKPLPDKPQPVAREGQWITGGGQLWEIPNDLVMVAKKDDGRLEWHVERINSCVSCGAPMTWKRAMFDRKASSMWALFSGLQVADIELMHHTPCFEAGTCKNANPLLGQSRLQAYSVAGALTSIEWITTAWARKGSLKYRIGGYRRWWIVPVVGYGATAVNIAVQLATWHSR